MMKREEVKAFIERIGTAKHRDTLYISNQPSRWLLDIFNGYIQLGVFEVDKPHLFKERETILVTMDFVKKKILFLKWTDYTVVAVRKLGVANEINY